MHGVVSALASNLNPAAAKAERLAALRLTLAKLETVPLSDERGGAALSLGDLDRHLPGAGLPCGVLNEITATHADRPAAFGFAFALAAIAQRARPGPAVLVATRRALRDFGQPYGPGLVQLGLDVDRLILVETANDKDALWAIEETLRADAGAAIVAAAIAGSLDLTTGRRLNLAAAHNRTPLALLSFGADPAGPAATRWRIASQPAARDRFGAFLHARWSAALERCRNGRPGHWLIEWNHVAHRFRVVEGLADRARPAQRDAPRGELAQLRRAG